MSDEYNKKHKEPTDSKGLFHGYQEWYELKIGTPLWLRGNAKHSEWVGYVEDNVQTGAIGEKGTEVNFYII